jgi:uncharacterized iron-regulated membrane protein
MNGNLLLIHSTFMLRENNTLESIQKLSMRKAIFTTHLLTACAAGAILVVLSVSGGLLIFENSIDAWIDPAMVMVKPATASLTLSRVIGLAGASARERVNEVHPGGPDRSTMVVTERHHRIYVDRHTGAILGIRTGPLPSVRLRQLHKNLLAGRMGERVVVAATFLLILQSLSGLYLWWPLKRVAVRTGASSRRFVFDLHHALGFYSALFICLVGITGLLRYYPAVTDKLFGAVPAASNEIPNARPVAGGISVDEVEVLAQKQFAGASLVRINLPAGETDPFVISARYPGDVSPFGLSEVYLDRHDGRVLWVHDIRSESASDRAQRIDRAIHTGEVGGRPSRVAAWLTCLAILVEIWSGFWMWWKRTRRSATTRLVSRAGATRTELITSER